MIKRNKKKSVYMGSLRNEAGFTFLTLLVTLTIFSVTIPFASYLLQSVNGSTYQEEIAVQLSFQFLRDDLLETTDYDITKDKLTMTRGEKEKVTIEQYENLIRRRVRGGNEIYLRNVQQVSFKKRKHGIHASITTQQGETYEKTIINYS